MLLLVAILLSVAVVMCESAESIRNDYGTLLEGLEWLFTMLFSVEYVMRMICTRRPMRYATSFYGIVDLLAILPTYIIALPLFADGPNVQRLAVIRALRLLRAFRIFKLA